MRRQKRRPRRQPHVIQDGRVDRDVHRHVNRHVDRESTDMSTATSTATPPAHVDHDFDSHDEGEGGRGWGVGGVSTIHHTVLRPKSNYASVAHKNLWFQKWILRFLGTRWRALVYVGHRQ